MGNKEPKEITLDDLARMMADGFAEVRDHIDGSVAESRTETNVRFTDVNKRIDNLSYKVGQLDAKLDEHRQETRDGFAAIHRVVGGMSHTLSDHEERIKELEGE